jgi:hypothetical protein
VRGSINDSKKTAWRISARPASGRGTVTCLL